MKPISFSGATQSLLVVILFSLAPVNSHAVNGQYDDLVVTEAMVVGDATANFGHFSWSGWPGYFPNGQDNMYTDLVISLHAGQFWGWVEVTICGRLSHENGTGKLTRRFGIGKNPGSFSFHGDDMDETVTALGHIAEDWHIGEPRFDLGVVGDDSDDIVFMRIYHLSNKGNDIVVHVAGMTTDDRLQFSLTAPAGLPPGEIDPTRGRHYMSIMQPTVGIGTLTPDVSAKLHVEGNTRVSGNVTAGGVTLTTVPGDVSMGEFSN